MDLIRRTLRRLLAGRAIALPTAPIPPPWPGIVARWVPLSSQLAAVDRVRLLRLTQLFVRDVPMEGCGGLDLTEEVRVTIAATASILLLNLPYPRFPGLRRVLVYPDTFVATRSRSGRSTAMAEAPVVELGEAWRDGMVVLSWRDIRDGGADPGDGHNVILHEFAHVLDYEDTSAMGRPPLASQEARASWSAVFTAAFDHQKAAVDRGEETVLDPYATTNHAEFFAVATEMFFEEGNRLRQHLPQLYQQLRLFYQQDPAARRGR